MSNLKLKDSVKLNIYGGVLSELRVLFGELLDTKSVKFTVRNGDVGGIYIEVELDDLTNSVLIEYDENMNIYHIVPTTGKVIKALGGPDLAKATASLLVGGLTHRHILAVDKPLKDRARVRWV